MRKLALLFALLLVPARAWALNIDNLLSTIALPLAVAAVSNANGASDSQLATLVSTLNQANVPPAQVIEVIRYVPVVAYDQNGQPFIAYVQQETTQGVTGDALVNAIADRLRTNYNVTPVMTISGEPTTFVLSDNFIPASVTTFSGNPASLIALPLAVAAVSDISGVPQDELANLVATLNNANVPPLQEIQIIRYSPVALVTDNGQPFVAFVQQQTSQGVTGPALVPVVVQQLQTFYPPQTQIVVNAPPQPAAAQQVVVEREFAPPPMVVSRVEEIRGNPHGGPPGQIKKQLGLQTGAEVVHGEKRGRQFTPMPAAAPTPVAVVPQPRGEEEHGHGRGRESERERMPAPMISSAPPPRAPVPTAVPPGQAKEHGDHEKGNGGEKGHGHGKD